MPDPARTPIFVRSSFFNASSSRPASRSALLPETKAYCRQSSMRRVLLVHEALVVEVADLRGELGGELADVEAVDLRHARRAREQLVVEDVVVVAEHRAQTHAGDHDALLRIRLASHRADDDGDARARAVTRCARGATRRGATAWRAPRTAREATAAIVCGGRRTEAPVARDVVGFFGGRGCRETAGRAGARDAAAERGGGKGTVGQSLVDRSGSGRDPPDRAGPGRRRAARAASAIRVTRRSSRGEAISGEERPAGRDPAGSWAGRPRAPAPCSTSGETDRSTGMSGRTYLACVDMPRPRLPARASGVPAPDR